MDRSLSYRVYTVNSDFPILSQDFANQTLPGWEYIIKLFLTKGSFVSDILTEDGKIAYLFFTV